jgi:hypothetical protein
MKALVLAGALVLASSSAWATIAISYTVDAGGPVSPVCVTNGNVLTDCGPSFNTAGNIFSVSGLQANSNSPGDATFDRLNSSSTVLTNLTTGTHTIVFSIYADGFNIPGAPALLTSSIGGSVGPGSAANLLSFRSCVSTTAGAACVGGVQTANLTPIITGTPPDFSDSNSAPVATLGIPYTLSEILTITLGAGSSMNFAATTRLIPTAVPEPASVLLFGSCLALAATWLRRRATKLG